MEYKAKSDSHNLIGPGTAGVAQRISLNSEGLEISGLYALVKNDISPCGQNQY